MAKLYLIRHGETDYNNAMRFQGRTDILLNQKGIEQAEKAAEFFRDIPLQAIYTSSLKRARTTAEIIGKVKGLEPQATDALQEMSFGIWENMNSKDIQKKYAKEWKDFCKPGYDNDSPGGMYVRCAETRLSCCTGNPGSVSGWRRGVCGPRRHYPCVDLHHAGAGSEPCLACACRECFHNLFLLLGPVLHAGLCKPDAILNGMASKQSIVLIYKIYDRSDVRTVRYRIDFRMT